MAGATFVFAWLACAALFVLQVQAGWEMLMPGDMPKGVAKRQDAPSPNGPRTVIDAGFGMFRDEHVTPQENRRLTRTTSKDFHGTTHTRHGAPSTDPMY
jgi:hypothetical protein